MRIHKLVIAAFLLSTTLVFAQEDGGGEEPVETTEEEDSAGETEQRLPNINYVGAGYDMLKGNPHPTGSGESQIDPGWRAEIFEVEHLQGNDFFSNGIAFLVPDGMTARSCSACSFEFSSSDLMTSSQYKESLRVSVEADFSGWGASFKASADYMNVQEKYEEQNTFFVESSGSCSFYCGSIDQFSPPPLSRNFMAAVERLPLEYDEDEYFNFIDEFGTHYAREVEMGGVFGEQSEITATAVRELEQTGYSASLSARYSSLAASGGIDVLVEGEREAASAFQSASTEQSSFAYGGRPRFGDSLDATEAWLDSVRADPLPLRYVLDQISNVVDDIHFPEDADIDTRYRNLVIALSGYCTALEQQNAIECADRDFDVVEAGSAGQDLSTVSVENLWDDGVEWERMGQPLLSDVRMWFGADGLETIQGVYDGNNLRYNKDALPWEDAEDRCLDEGAHLVSVQTEADNTRMVEFVNLLFDNGQVPMRPGSDPPIPQSFWLGLNDFDREGLHLWTDGLEVSFTAWGEGEPNNVQAGTEQCVEYRTPAIQQDWNDQSCTAADARPFLCKWPREHGIYPAQVRRPVEFNLASNEFINAVEVCEPERLGSLRFFTTQGRTSERYSLASQFSPDRTTGTSCLQQNGAFFNIPAANRIFSTERTADDWQQCQQWCLSQPDCVVWNFNVLLNTCRLGTSHEGLSPKTSNNEIACPTRECRDCTEHASGFHRLAVDGCRRNGDSLTDECHDIRNTDTARAAVRCCALDGSSCRSEFADPVCTSNVTYQEAFDFCDSEGMRLCSGSESSRLLSNGGCCETGCSFDDALIWSNQECASELQVPAVNTENCQTFQFSDRLGLVHFSGAVNDDGKMVNIGFNGFQEIITEQALLEIPAGPVSGARSSMPISAPTLVACVALASLRQLFA